MTPLLACVLLAGVDIAGTFYAVEASRGNRWGWLGGPVAFLALFLLLVAAVKYASLTGVMIGWIVLVQLGAMFIDTHMIGTYLPPRVWVGCAVALAGLAYAAVSLPASS